MTTFAKLTAAWAAPALTALLAPLTSLGAQPNGAAQATDTSVQQGVWQKHEFTFAYLGFTSTYSCDGLADKIKVLLTAAGARKDSVVRSGGCASGFGRPDKFARAYLTFYTLAPADTNQAGEGAVIHGSWRNVLITDRSPRELGTGDCELVEQFSRDVLGMFSTRNVENNTTCIPHQNSGSVIDLKFETFTGPKGAKG